MEDSLEDNPDFRFLVEELARAGQGLAVLLKEDVSSRALLRGYVNYLLGEKPRNYGALSDYLGWWGARFIWPDIQDMMQGRRYDTAIELGPGSGWLIKAMRIYVQAQHLYAVDKRWQLIDRKDSFTFLVQDMEVNPTLDLITDPRQTLIIANQFLHCVDNREDIVRRNRADWLVVEVSSLTWQKQLREFGATPLTGLEVEDLFRMNEYQLMDRKKSTVVTISMWRPR